MGEGKAGGASLSLGWGGLGGIAGCWFEAAVLQEMVGRARAPLYPGQHPHGVELLSLQGCDGEGGGLLAPGSLAGAVQSRGSSAQGRPVCLYTPRVIPTLKASSGPPTPRVTVLPSTLEKMC